VEPSSKTDITKCFLEAEQGLLHYGQYAARLPMAVEKVCRWGETLWASVKFYLVLKLKLYFKIRFIRIRP